MMWVAAKHDGGVVELRLRADAKLWGGSVVPGDDIDALVAEGSLPEVPGEIRAEIQGWWDEPVAGGELRRDRWLRLQQEQSAAEGGEESTE